MRVLILGGSGMLGHKLCRELSNHMDIWATFRTDPENSEASKILPRDKAIGHVYAEELESLNKALDTVQPDVVVNCIGIVKQRDEAKYAIPSIRVNALFPHQLAETCAARGVRVIQISTDCVFSGLRGNYSEIDIPDPVDLYGRTKLLGELDRPGCLTLRTSIIGWQLKTHSSLLGWFASQRGCSIKGYRRAIYSGFSTKVISVLIGDMILTRPDLSGLFHVASAPISKYDLLIRLRDKLGWKDISIEPDDQFLCDRSLISTRFLTATGWTPPVWDDMIGGLADEWFEYKQIVK